MKLRWTAFRQICAEVAAAYEPAHCWIEDRGGEVKAGERPDPDRGRVSLPLGPDGSADSDYEYRACAVSEDSGVTAQLLWTLCRREINHQDTVRDMADATARLWRQTNALLRMAASTHLSVDPGLAVEKILAVLEHSTSFLPGLAVVRMPGVAECRVFGVVDGKKVDVELLPTAEEVDEEVLLVTPAERPDLHARCCRVLGHEGAIAVGKLATDNQHMGYLILPASDTELVTSEDVKVLAAAVQILSVAIENGFILRREREAIKLKVENEMLAAHARDLEEMTHVVAHDLRSPMTSIYGFMHVALDELQDMSDKLRHDGVSGASDLQPLVADPLHDAIKSVEKLNRMIQRLLDFSRSARTSYTFEKLDLNELVDGVVSSVGYHLREKRITVEVEELTSIVGDRVQVEAVFGNLVDNAIKYMGEDGEKRIVVGMLDKDEGPVFFVRDTGTGMRPEQVKKAFLPFKRFHTDSAPGEGIGLAHVRKIVERHRGRIWCESSEGEGTTFYFTLQAAESMNDSPSPSPN